MIFTKPNKKNTQLITLKIPEEINNKLLDRASKLNISRSELIRNYIEKSLQEDNQITDEQEELFLKHAKIALNEILKPQVERICAISAKSGITSAAAYFLSATTFNAFVHPSMKSEFANAIDAAKKIGVEYMRSNDKSIEEIMENGVQRMNKKYLSK